MRKLVMFLVLDVLKDFSKFSRSKDFLKSTGFFCYFDCEVGNKIQDRSTNTILYVLLYWKDFNTLNLTNVTYLTSKILLNFLISFEPALKLS